MAALYQLLGSGLVSRRELELLTDMLDGGAAGEAPCEEGDEAGGAACENGDGAVGISDPMGDRLVRLLKSASQGALAGHGTRGTGAAPLPPGFIALAHAVGATYTEREHLILSYESAHQFEQGTWDHERYDPETGGDWRLPSLARGYHLPLPAGVSRDDYVAALDRRAAAAAAANAWGDDVAASLPLTAEELAAQSSSPFKAARDAGKGPPEGPLEGGPGGPSQRPSKRPSKGPSNGPPEGPSKGPPEGPPEGPLEDPLLGTALPALDGAGVRLVPTGDLFIDAVRVTRGGRGSNYNIF